MSTIPVMPTKLELRPPQRLCIGWSDGSAREYNYRELQDACPCASCREKQAAAPPAAKSPFAVLSMAETQPLELLAVTPVGNYAYTFTYNHGCGQGIYTFDALRTLGKEVAG